jgi:hypothetical protein
VDEYTRRGGSRSSEGNDESELLGLSGSYKREFGPSRPFLAILELGKGSAVEFGSLRIHQVIAEVLSGTILERFLRSIDPSWLGIPNLWHAHSNLWADNGDYLSKYGLSSCFSRFIAF